MQELKLTRGFVARIDDGDFDRATKHKWCVLMKKNGKVYAQANIKTDGVWRRTMLHRFLMNAAHGRQIDHIDNDGLNCQRSNLRFATPGQNQHNQGTRRGRFKGVSWHRKAGKWVVQIAHNNKREYLGLFISEEDAARAYDARAKEVHGEFAKTNF